MQQLSLNFESNKPKLKAPIEHKKSGKKKRSKMGYDTEVGKLATHTESLAASRLNKLNPKLSFVLHPIESGQDKNYKQDLDVYFESKMIGHVEVQTTLTASFDGYSDWQFYRRRIEKNYKLPFVHVQQDSKGELLILTKDEYKAFYLKNGKYQARYYKNKSYGGMEWRCDLPIFELTLFREKSANEEREKRIYEFLTNTFTNNNPSNKK